MPDVGEAYRADFDRFGRMDARFYLLVRRHRQLVDELLARFTREELIDLARRLPFDAESADAVVPGKLFARSVRQRFEVWLKLKTVRATDLAVYCAGAAQWAVSRALTVVLELAEKRAAAVRELQALVAFADGKEAPTFCEAIRKGSEEELRKVQEVDKGC